MWGVQMTVSLLEDSLKVAVCWLADFIHKLTLQLAKLQSSDNHLIIKHKGFSKTKHTKSIPHHNPKIISILAQLCKLCNFANPYTGRDAIFCVSVFFQKNSRQFFGCFPK
jgi:hypothetical protein